MQKKMLLNISMIIKFTITLLIITITILTFISTVKQYTLVKKFFPNKQIYTINNNTMDYFKKDDALEKLKDFYELMKTSKDFECVNGLPNNILLEVTEKNKQYIYNRKPYKDEDMSDLDLALFNSLEISENFFDILPYNMEPKVIDDFKNGVILGNDYKDTYAIGDEITRYNKSKKTKIEKLKVKAFLEKNSFFISNQGQNINLDNKIILLDDSETPYDKEIDEKVYYVNSIFFSSLVVDESKNISYSQIEKTLQSYNEKVGLLDSMEVRDLTSVLNKLVLFLVGITVVLIILSLLNCIFTIKNVSKSLLPIFEERKEKFDITSKQIIILISTYTLIAFIISLIPTYYLYDILIGAFEYPKEIIIYSLIFSIFLITILSRAIIQKLKLKFISSNEVQIKD